MAAYLARVELHGAIYQDYQNLHSYMQEAGFLNHVIGDNDSVYQLPPAEYYLQSSVDHSVEAVRDHARNAANRTGKSNSILTAKTNGIAWSDLTPLSGVNTGR